MRREFLALEEATVVDGVSITPVVRVSSGYTEIRGALSFFAGKQPVYLVIKSAVGERAYSVTGLEVPIQQVVSDCPALAVALEGRPVPRFQPH